MIQTRLVSDLFKSDGNMLIFKSSEDYNSLIENPTDEDIKDFITIVQGLEHTTYKEHLESTHIDDTLMDDFLAVILNKDLIVQIGDYLYRVNLEEGKVFVLPAKKIEEYADLVSENESNVNIKSYRVDEDVIDIVEKGLCNEISAPGRIERAESTREASSSPSGCNVLYNFHWKVKYFSAGIFFNLYAEIKSYKISYCQGLATKSEIYPYNVRISGTRKYKKRCKAESGWEVKVPKIGIYNPLTLQSYQGSRSLTKYWFIVSFEYFEDGVYKKVSSLPNMYAPYHTGVKFGY